MPEFLKNPFHLLDAGLTLVEALRQVPARDHFIVVARPGRKYACFLRADLHALSLQLEQHGVDPADILLGRLASPFAAPGAPLSIDEASFANRLRLFRYRLLYEILVGEDASGRPAQLMVSGKLSPRVFWPSQVTVDRLAEAISFGIEPVGSEEAPKGWRGIEKDTESKEPFEDFDEIPSYGLPEMTPEPAPRRVQAQVRRLDGPQPVLLRQAFAAGKPHSLEVWISAAEYEAIRANTPINESMLRGKAQYDLEVMFVELNHSPQPQTATITLPDGAGDSTHCVFAFTTRADAPDFRGRLVISYADQDEQRRVLQTLLLTGRVLEDPATVAPDEVLALTEEAVLHDSLDSMDGLQGVAVSMVQEGGVLIFQSSGEPVRVDITDLPKFTEAVEKELEDVTKHPEDYTGLYGEENQALLRILARHGRLLYKKLARSLGEDNALFQPGMARFQLLSATDMIFPLEMVYVCPGGLDVDNAPLCPHAAESLQAGRCSTCEDLDEEAAGQVICPLRFLGLSKVIERQRLEDNKTNPAPGRSQLTPLRSAVYAQATEKVLQADAARLTELVQKYIPAAAYCQDWNEWQREVAAKAPALLLLVPHTDEKYSIMTLEIGMRKVIAADSITPKYVRCSKEDTPIVLLLGCSTGSAPIPFEGAAPAFRSGGAALAVTSLIPVLGRFIVPIVDVLLDQLQQAAQQRRSFGEALLRTRQQAMVNGNTTVLALVAEGNIDWKIVP